MKGGWIVALLGVLVVGLGAYRFFTTQIIREEQPPPKRTVQPADNGRTVDRTTTTQTSTGGGRHPVVLPEEKTPPKKTDAELDKLLDPAEAQRLLSEGHQWIPQLLNNSLAPLSQAKGKLDEILKGLNERISAAQHNNRDARAFLEARRAIVDQLVRTLDDPRIEKDFTAAYIETIRLLGESGDEAAIGPLVRLIDYTGGGILGPPGINSANPAYRLLPDFGRAAVPSIIESAADDGSETRLQMMAAVLKRIESGQRHVNIETMVYEAVKKEADFKRRAHLHRLQTLLKRGPR